MTEVCEHGAASHDGMESSVASAPEASRAWLLIEHPGPWPHEPAEAVLPPPLAALVSAADALGVRVQMIRRPGRGRIGPARSIYAGWTEGPQPWLRHAEWSRGIRGQAGGRIRWTRWTWRSWRRGARRSSGRWSASRCSWSARTRSAAPAARGGAGRWPRRSARYPGQVFQTTHVGGHRFAANLVILPHGLCYGPVGLDGAVAAIGAYQRGTVAPSGTGAGPGRRRRPRKPSTTCCLRAGRWTSQRWAERLPMRRLALCKPHGCGNLSKREVFDKSPTVWPGQRADS